MSGEGRKSQDCFHTNYTKLSSHRMNLKVLKCLEDPIDVVRRLTKESSDYYEKVYINGWFLPYVWRWKGKENGNFPCLHLVRRKQRGDN